MKQQLLHSLWTSKSENETGFPSFPNPSYDYYSTLIKIPVSWSLISNTGPSLSLIFTNLMDTPHSLKTYMP